MSKLDIFERREELHPELRGWIEPDGPLGPMLRHPLIYELCATEQTFAYINQRYLQMHTATQDKLLCGDYVGYVALHERPYRFQAMAKIGADIESDQEFWELFAWVWKDSENIWQQRRHIEQILRLSRPGHEFMMDESEREKFASLPARVTVYRGHQGINKRGWSWTINREKAEWFARRWKDAGRNGISAVATRKVCRSQIAAYFDGEDEVILLGKLFRLLKPTVAALTK